MALDLLKNVRERIRQAHEILQLEPWLLEELTTFKNRQSFDLFVKIEGTPKYFKGVRVWHRTPQAKGIYKGGNRYDPSVSLSAMESHAMEMSVKAWLKDLFLYGGAKGGIEIDPLSFTPDQLEAITKKFVDECFERNFIGPAIDIPAPDVGTNSQIMHWMKEHYVYLCRKQGRDLQESGAVVTGKPITRDPSESGCPGRRQATGLGMFFALDEYRKLGLVSLPARPRVVIQGFGNVGMHFAYFLHHFDYADIIAIFDRFGGVYNPEGLDIPRLIQHASSSPRHTVTGFKGGGSVDPSEFYVTPCDIQAPCALEGVYTERNAELVRASLIVEGANGPTTPEADRIFQEMGVVVLPDVDVNAGGVVGSFFEHGRNTNSTDPRIPQGGFDKVAEALEKFMRRSVGEIAETQERYKLPKGCLRLAAYVRALEKAAPLFRMKRLSNVAEEFDRLEKDIEKHPW